VLIFSSFSFVYDPSSGSKPGEIGVEKKKTISHFLMKSTRQKTYQRELDSSDIEE
jgi:hypothetical protein